MNDVSHWTAQSDDAFRHSVAANFICQIEKRMEHLGMTQAQLATKLGVSQGRVSQTLNAANNLTLATAVKYAKTTGMKVALVAYDNSDPSNECAPVNSEIFALCWEHMKRPSDFFELETARSG